MNTRAEFASFIRALLSGSNKAGEWERLVMTHYTDTTLEDARRELVRESIQQGGVSAMRAAHLSNIIKMLENEK